MGILRRWCAFTAALEVLLLGACAPPSATPAPSAVPTASVVRHAAEIRFALIGPVTDANVWALFDAQSYSYNNYAVRSAYWPRLYDLSIPDRQFEVVAASGMPSPIRQEGPLYAATVPLRTDLTWTDGAPLSAEDVAFTVNTALAFHLGFDWSAYFNPEWLDHAEAIDAHTVEFFFSKLPDAGSWQFGALQGPIVQHTYWAARITQAAGLLPSNDVLPQIEELKNKVADLQHKVAVLVDATLSTTTAEQARQLQADLRRQQGNLDEATNDLAKAQDGMQQALNTARGELYALKATAEPYLGRWQPGATAMLPDGGPALVNEPNANLPGGASNFDRATYTSYDSREAALAALQRGEVDVILDPAAPSGGIPAPNVMVSQTHRIRFLAFNTRLQYLGPPLRQAIACLLDQVDLLGGHSDQAAPLAAFVLPEEASWFNADAVLPCHELDATQRLLSAVSILKAAGYTWQQEPGGQTAGRGLTSPDGKLLPAIELWAPASDAVRASAAAYSEKQARWLGIPLTARMVVPDAIEYGVFSSGNYEMALLGWRVGSYPGYLCDWFGSDMPFDDASSRVASICAELAATSDLDKARGQIREIQSILAQEVPMIPLYSELTYDVYRNVGYPFAQVLDGLTGVYGAPGLAFPTAP